MKPIVYIFVMFALNVMGQNFSNADLEGNVGMSATPPDWYAVSSSDPVCQAYNNMVATPDITGSQGPVTAIGLVGVPHSGNSFVSGLISGLPGAHHQEGIRQTVHGLTPGKPYTISFYQTVVKQNNQLDNSGSWGVYADNQLIQVTQPSQSSLAFDDPSLIWEERNISFTPTHTVHSFKFLPMDDDPSQAVPMESLRMGIDNITLTPDSSHVYHDTICYGELATIWAEGASQYHWISYNDPGNVLGYDSILQVSPDSTSHYWCITNLDTNLVTVTVLFPPTLDLGPDHKICMGDATIIHPDVHHANTHLWSDGSNGYDLETDQDGLVWMIAENNCGVARDSVLIAYDSLEFHDFGFDTMICTYETVELSAYYPNASYSWNQGSTEPSILAEHAGDYWVKVENECGAFMHEFHVEFDPECEILIEMPNVFTPDNDGVNDFFVPVQHEHLQSYHLFVLNRWGEIIFESVDINLGWDGTIQGENANESVYFYKVDYSDFHSENNSVQGSFTLVR
ncbi:MAG: gliding motility-associated C-terminal domain-containing protein [Fluviicola sp.]